MKIKIGLLIMALLSVFINTTIQEKNNYSESINIKFLSVNANAQTEVAACLGNYVYENQKAEVKGKKCWADATGPDVFQGYVVSCNGGGLGCQPTFCQDMKGCYTSD